MYKVQEKRKTLVSLEEEFRNLEHAYTNNEVVLNTLAAKQIHSYNLCANKAEADMNLQTKLVNYHFSK